MGFTLEVLAATACVLGLTGFAWWLLGRILRPLPGQSGYILLLGRGEGADLEQTVRGFLWLRSLGLLKVPVIIADAGLNGPGREVALRLCARWPGVILWPADDIGTYLTQTK